MMGSPSLAVGAPKMRLTRAKKLHSEDVRGRKAAFDPSSLEAGAAATVIAAAPAGPVSPPKPDLRMLRRR